MVNTRHVSYCDYIGRVIQSAIDRDTLSYDGLLAGCGSIKSDLHPVDGYFMSTKKTINVADRNGRLYEITIKDVTK